MVGERWREVVRRLLRRHRAVKSFEHETELLGGIGGGHEIGLKIVPVDKIVGSVGRWQNLRSDFFYRSGEMTERFLRIGRAMRRGTDLPPIEVYKLKRSAGQSRTEYYVVDGHHRVAMARELGQVFLDANVKEFKVSDPKAAEQPGTVEKGDVR